MNPVIPSNSSISGDSAYVGRALVSGFFWLISRAWCNSLLFLLPTTITRFSKAYPRLM
jgi:hypothetical protein